MADSEEKSESPEAEEKAAEEDDNKGVEEQKEDHVQLEQSHSAITDGPGEKTVEADADVEKASDNKEGSAEESVEPTDHTKPDDTPNGAIRPEDVANVADAKMEDAEVTGDIPELKSSAPQQAEPETVAQG